MRPLLYRFNCASCNAFFKAPCLPDELYGEFIMRSKKNGEPAYLNSFTDKVFDEVEKIFQENEIVKKQNKMEDAAFFHAIFSISCDLASDGTSYVIGLQPICPCCGSRTMAGGIPTAPPEFGTTEIRSITHDFWNKLKKEDKISLISKAINDYM